MPLSWGPEPLRDPLKRVGDEQVEEKEEEDAAENPEGFGGHMEEVDVEVYCREQVAKPAEKLDRIHFESFCQGRKSSS